MSDPIGMAIRGVGATPGTDVASRLAQLRDAVEQGGRIGTDSARKIPIDIGRNSGETFGSALTRALNEVSAAQDRAGDAVERFVRGDPVELHEVMAASEEAGLALELLVELRNKVTDAYRTVMSMQS